MKTTAEHPSTSARAQELELARLIVETLKLNVDPVTISPEAPLFGDGLGLDSIDMLEIALVVAQTYGIKLRADNAENDQIFRSLASLNQHIQQHRA